MGIKDFFGSHDFTYADIDPLPMCIKDFFGSLDRQEYIARADVDPLPMCIKDFFGSRAPIVDNRSFAAMVVCVCAA